MDSGLFDGVGDAVGKVVRKSVTQTAVECLGDALPNDFSCGVVVGGGRQAELILRHLEARIRVAASPVVGETEKENGPSSVRDDPISSVLPVLSSTAAPSAAAPGQHQHLHPHGINVSRTSPANIGRGNGINGPPPHDSDRAAEQAVVSLATDAVDRLQHCGLNRVPAWLRPLRVLSNGEQSRVRLALELQTGFILRNFAATVDSQNAKSMAYGLRKLIKRTAVRKIVLSTEKTGLLRYLQPDFVVWPVAAGTSSGPLQALVVRNPAVVDVPDSAQHQIRNSICFPAQNHPSAAAGSSVDIDRSDVGKTATASALELLDVLHDDASEKILATPAKKTTSATAPPPPNSIHTHLPDLDSKPQISFSTTSLKLHSNDRDGWRGGEKEELLLRPPRLEQAAVWRNRGRKPLNTQFPPVVQPRTLRCCVVMDDLAVAAANAFEFEFRGVSETTIFSPVVDHISCRVFRVFSIGAVIGPSGCGKSTALGVFDGLSPGEREGRDGEDLTKKAGGPGRRSDGLSTKKREGQDGEELPGERAGRDGESGLSTKKREGRDGEDLLHDEKKTLLTRIAERSGKPERVVKAFLEGLGMSVQTQQMPPADLVGEEERELARLGALLAPYLVVLHDDSTNAGGRVENNIPDHDVVGQHDDPRAPVLCVDEFTSLVSRPVAERVCLAIAKSVRGGGLGVRLVVAGVHDDVLDWLRPDFCLHAKDGLVTVPLQEAGSSGAGTQAGAGAGEDVPQAVHRGLVVQAAQTKRNQEVCSDQQEQHLEKIKHDALSNDASSCSGDVVNFPPLPRPTTPQKTRDDDVDDLLQRYRERTLNLLNPPKLQFTVRRIEFGQEKGIWERFLRDVWMRKFEEHHYLKGTLSHAMQCFSLRGGEVEDISHVAPNSAPLVGFLGVVIQPGAYSDGISFRESRLVVLPEYQGLGIGPRFSDTMGQLYLDNKRRYSSKSAQPGLRYWRSASKLWREMADSGKIARPDQTMSVSAKKSRVKAQLAEGKTPLPPKSLKRRGTR